MSAQDVYDHRKSKFLKIGRDKGFIKSSYSSDQGLGYEEPKLLRFGRHLNSYKFIYIGIVFVFFAAMVSLFN